MKLSLPALKPVPRYALDAPVVAHEQIGSNEFEIVLYAPPVAQTARPGQFLELLFGDNYAPLLRRPFSLYRVNREAGTLSVLYLARGAFTSGLAQKSVGDILSLLGPLGRPFQWTAAPGLRHILIAGGLGAPPLYFLAREISRDLKEQGVDSQNVTVINGARTQDLLIGMVEFGALNIVLRAVTDDGSHGLRGLATELLLALLEEFAARDAAAGLPPLPTQLYACGPTPMLRAVGEIAIERGQPCQISVETAMPCGIGTCQGCAIAVQDPDAPERFAYARACWDGPVFEARDLIWSDTNG